MVKKDIEVVKGILNKEIIRDGQMFCTKQNKYHGYYGHYSLIYLFTNDILDDIQEEIKGKKKILTVAASGDHLLNCICEGANIVQSYDINILTKYYQAFKIAMVKALEYDEFLKIFEFNSKGKINLDYKNFNKILNSLEGDDFKFWEGIYDPKLLENFDLLINPVYSFEKSPLANKEKYNKIKSNLKNCEILPFIDTDLFDLYYALNKKYDAILSSNITSHFDSNDITLFFAFMNQVGELLNDDGIFQFGHYVKRQYLNNGAAFDKKSNNAEVFYYVAKKYCDGESYKKECENSISYFYKKTNMIK